VLRCALRSPLAPLLRFKGPAMTNITIEKAVPLQGTASKTSLPNNNRLTKYLDACTYQKKRFPAFGKRIMEKRIAGELPTSSAFNHEVVVVFDWNLGAACSRIVIPERVPISSLEFRFLAGLNVQIVYRDKDAHRVVELAEKILFCSPKSLIAFSLEGKQNLILKSVEGEVYL